MLCFRKLPAAKKFMDRREGEVSRFSGEKFLSHSAEKVRRATFCASFFSVIEKVWMRGWWGAAMSRFSVENFLSHSTEKRRR